MGASIMGGVMESPEIEMDFENSMFLE